MKTLLVILGFAMTAQAQTLPRIALWGGTAADIATTRYGVTHGLREGNPVVGNSTARHASLSLGTAAMVDYFATHHANEKHGKTLMWISAGVRIAAAVWNVRQVRK